MILLSTKCSDEGEAMGHCANTSKGSTLLSLRRYKQPHVTISWEESDNIFYQIKGKGNDKPVEKYHKYIVDLICHLEVTGKRSEYQGEDDFSPDDLSEELYAKLSNCNQQYIDNQGMTDEELEDRYREDDTITYGSENNSYSNEEAPSRDVLEINNNYESEEKKHSIVDNIINLFHGEIIEKGEGQ